MNTHIDHRWPRILGLVTTMALALTLLGGAKKGCTKIEPQQPICNVAADCEGMATPDCDGKWSCDLGECNFICTPAEQTCFGNGDCSNGQVCDFTNCVAPKSSDCAPGAPCPPFVACMGLCKDEQPPVEETCFGDGDCAAGQICDFTNCIAPKNSDCAPGAPCAPLVIACMGLCTDKSTPVGECQADSDCGPTEYCAIDSCAACACLAGQPCDCAIPVCTGKCAPKAEPSMCYSDADCNKGYSCVCNPVSSCPNCLVACIGECIAQPPSDNQWWVSCGTAICGGYSPKPGIPACSGQSAGQPCSAPGAQCDLVGNTCNQTLICTNSDPTTNGCPKSQVEAKTAIRLMNDTDRTLVYETLQSMPLAQYTYKDDPTHTMRLGFLIGHGGPKEAVLPSGDRVDLYAYTSMAIAALQAQAKEIDSLKATVKTLSEQVETLKGQSKSSVGK